MNVLLILAAHLEQAAMLNTETRPAAKVDYKALIEPTRINGKHTYTESSFFVRGNRPGQIPEDMKVENVLDVIMPQEQTLRKAA